MSFNREPFKTLTPCEIIALDIGGTKIAGAIVSYQNATDLPTITYETSAPTEAKQGGPKVLKRVEELIDLLRGYTIGRPLVIGIGTAGRVDAGTGIIAYANENIPGWLGQPLGPYLSRRFELPVAVLNDVQSYALGEARWGAARNASDVLVVAAGTGIGGAIISHGQLMLGAHGFAGEVGHCLHPAAADITCSCGHKGHIESIASGWGIEAGYVRAGGDPLSGAQIADRAKAGEELARTIIELAGRSLGECLGSWAGMLDPELIIISGSVAKAGAIWRKALEQGIDAQFPDGHDDLPVLDAELDNHAPLIGAAEYALEMLAATQMPTDISGPVSSEDDHRVLLIDDEPM